MPIVSFDKPERTLILDSQRKYYEAILKPDIELVLNTHSGTWVSSDDAIRFDIFDQTWEIHVPHFGYHRLYPIKQYEPYFDLIPFENHPSTFPYLYAEPYPLSMTNDLHISIKYLRWLGIEIPESDIPDHGQCTIDATLLIDKPLTFGKVIEYEQGGEYHYSWHVKLDNEFVIYYTDGGGDTWCIVHNGISLPLYIENLCKTAEEFQRKTNGILLSHFHLQAKRRNVC